MRTPRTCPRRFPLAMRNHGLSNLCTDGAHTRSASSTGWWAYPPRARIAKFYRSWHLGAIDFRGFPPIVRLNGGGRGTESARGEMDWPYPLIVLASLAALLFLLLAFFDPG